MFIFLIISILVQSRINSNNKKLILSQTGLPVSKVLDIPKDYLLDEENIFICLSTECNICQKLIVDFCENKRRNYYLLFSENKVVVDNLINTLNVSIEKQKIIYDYQEEKLYLSVTPFVYITDAKGVILEKKVINKIEEI